MTSEPTICRGGTRCAWVVTVAFAVLAGCGFVCAADGVTDVDLQAMVAYVNLDFANVATGVESPLGDTPFSVVAADHLKFTTDVPGEFYDDFFEPEMRSQLWDVRNNPAFEMIDPSLQNDQARQDIAELTVKSIEKAGRYAAGDYFLLLTGLEDRGREVASSIAGGIASSTTSAGKPKKIRYKLGAYHYLPKIGIDYRISGAQRLTVTVAAAGHLNVDFSHVRRKWAILGFGYNHENRYYSLNARLSF
jgi:hypothetical protein